jgi:type II secretion system protein D
MARTSRYPAGLAALLLVLSASAGAIIVPQVVAQDATDVVGDNPTGPASTSRVQAYGGEGGDPWRLAERWRQQFRRVAGVTIAVDPRSERVLVQAPNEVHRLMEIELAQVVTEPQDPEPTLAVREPGFAERLPDTDVPQPARQPAALDAPLDRPRDTPPPQQPQRPERPSSSANSSLNWNESTAVERDDQLRAISLRDLMTAVEGFAGQPVSVRNLNSGQVVQAELPSQQGVTTLQADPRTGRFQLRGSAASTDAWLRAIRALDKRSPNDTTQLVPVSETTPDSINRALELLRDAQQRGASPNRRWGADVVGIQGGKTAPLQLAQAPQPPVDAAPEAPPAEPAPEDLPADADAVEAVVGGEVGMDGSLIGQVQIEYVEGLDAIIIRGRKPDVDRVMRIIDELEELGAVPLTIEIVDLQHVNSQSMADLIAQLNTQLSIRIGSVSITPLVKPNALLLIGRQEGVNATIDLIKRLDQPVAPTSQFSIFRLQHVPAVDAVETITAFFANRGGLSPRILVQADYRTNSVIVYASPRDLAEVKQLLSEIDVTENAATSEVRVFKLNNALAEELAQVLQDTLLGAAAGEGPGGPGQAGGAGGQATGVPRRSTTLTLQQLDAAGKRLLKSGILTEVRVAADVRANSLVVTAPAESMDLIAALVTQLDQLPTSEAAIKVFTVVNGDAAALVTMLNELFGQQAGQGNQQTPFAPSAIGAGESSLVPLRFSTDLRTNSIIATGSGEDLEVVEAILLRLDASDASKRRSRVYRLQNAPALEVATAINQYLQTERQITLSLAADRVSPFEQIEREVVVVPETVSNSLIISATPRYFDEIVALVEELDARPPMVTIQVLIAEVDLNNIEELGVELGIQDSLLFDRSVIANNIAVPGFNFNNQPLGNSSSAQSLATRENTAGQGLTNFGVGRTNGQLGYGGLRALQQSQRMDVLSRPQVTTLNNQPAYVLVGQRVPRIQSVNQTQFGVTNSTILEDVGLVLGVTPRISPDGLVVMEIDAQKSELGPIDEGIPISINNNGDVIRSPIINTTEAQTTVSARNGQTVILGGLITKNRNVLARRVPYLSDIPVLGNLFRYDSVGEARTELLIIMTPYIHRNPEDTELLNQIESRRMSWCLADVIDVHGDTGMSAGGVCAPQVPTEVIYPTQDPAAGEYFVPGSMEEVPAGPVQQSPTPPAEGALPQEWMLDQQGKRLRPPSPDDFSAGRGNGSRPTQVISPVQYTNDPARVSEQPSPEKRRFWQSKK